MGSEIILEHLHFLIGDILTFFQVQLLALKVLVTDKVELFIHWLYEIPVAVLL